MSTDNLITKYKLNFDFFNKYPKLVGNPSDREGKPFELESQLTDRKGMITLSLNSKDMHRSEFIRTCKDVYKFIQKGKVTSSLFYIPKRNGFKRGDLNERLIILNIDHTKPLQEQDNIYLWIFHDIYKRLGRYQASEIVDKYCSELVD